MKIILDGRKLVKGILSLWINLPSWPNGQDNPLRKGEKRQDQQLKKLGGGVVDFRVNRRMYQFSPHFWATYTKKRSWDSADRRLIDVSDVEEVGPDGRKRKRVELTPPPELSEAIKTQITEAIA
jgi:hypothetical protein